MASIRYYLTLFIVALCCTCGHSIYGGKLAEEQQFSFMAAIHVRNSHDVMVLTGAGAIITPNLVLTACHCTDAKGRDNTELYRVFVGSTNKSGGQEFQVNRFISHELYNSFHLRKDLVFIELKMSIRFSASVQPIQMNRDFIDAGIPVMFAGWGKTNDDIKSLKFIEMETMTNDQCRMNLISKPHKPLICNNVICAYSGKIGTGSCDGDSGAPLVFNNTLIGILTWEYGCAEGFPTIFQRISLFFDDFIDNVLREYA